MGHSAGGDTAAFLAFNRQFLRKFGADPKDIVGLVADKEVLPQQSIELRDALEKAHVPVLQLERRPQG
jgi:hypothetical protein